MYCFTTSTSHGVETISSGCGVQASLMLFLKLQLLCPPEASSGYFGLAFATPPRREIFGVNAVRGKLHQLGSPNLQDIFLGG